MTWHERWEFFSLKSSVLCLHDRVESFWATNEMKSGFILLFTIFSIENFLVGSFNPLITKSPPNLIHGRYHWDYDCTQKVQKNLLFLLNWLFSASSPPLSSLLILHACSCNDKVAQQLSYVCRMECKRLWANKKKFFICRKQKESETGTLWGGISGGVKKETRTTQKTLGTARKIIKTFVSSTILWWFLANEFHVFFCIVLLLSVVEQFFLCSYVKKEWGV